MSTVTPSLSGPKRPHDRVALSEMKQDFIDCLNNRVGFKGFGIPAEKQSVEVPFTFEGQDYKLSHGKITHQHVEVYVQFIFGSNIYSLLLHATEFGLSSDHVGHLHFSVTFLN